MYLTRASSSGRTLVGLCAEIPTNPRLAPLVVGSSSCSSLLINLLHPDPRPSHTLSASSHGHQVSAALPSHQLRKMSELIVRTVNIRFISIIPR